MIEANNKKVDIELIPNDLGQNLDLEKWSLTKAILLIKKSLICQIIYVGTKDLINKFVWFIISEQFF